MRQIKKDIHRERQKASNRDKVKKKKPERQREKETLREPTVMNTLYLSLESDITLYCSTLLLKTESLSFLRLKERGSYRVGWHGVKHSDKNCGATQQMGKDEVDGMKTKHKKNY